MRGRSRVASHRVKKGQVLHLWTIQHPAVWDLVRERGVYRADGRRTFRWFRPAYRWMIGQMGRRLTAYPTGRYPVWAWHAPKPDMRMCAYRPQPGEEVVRLTLEIPDADAAVRVLLSGFEAWGVHALNNSYLWVSDEELEWWTGLDGARPLGRRLPPRLQGAVHRSWERIFDLGLMEQVERESEAPYLPLRVQATLGEIRPGDVVAVERFRGPASGVAGAGASAGRGSA